MADNVVVTTDVRTYLTVTRAWGPVEIREKGSRFIAWLFPAPERQVAETHLSDLRRQYHDSTHVCFAWRLGKGVEREHRYNDDGEPGGTAGLPIFNEILRRDYLDVVVAVVRYFGGVKLGTGGLARAYGRAARAVLEVSQAAVVHLTDSAVVEFPFDLTGEVMQVARRLQAEIVAQEHAATGTRMSLLVPRGSLDALRAGLLEAGAGRVTLTPGKSTK